MCRRFWRANSKFEPEGRYPSAPYGHEWKAVSAVIEKESTPDKEIKALQYTGPPVLRTGRIVGNRRARRRLKMAQKVIRRRRPDIIPAIKGSVLRNP